MFIGFDYGTSNCAVAVMEQGSPRLLTLSGSHYLPSTLYSLETNFHWRIIQLFAEIVIYKQNNQN
jgi:molecular chaperone DnaK (HSP70)